MDYVKPVRTCYGMSKAYHDTQNYGKEVKVMQMTTMAEPRNNHRLEVLVTLTRADYEQLRALMIERGELQRFRAWLRSKYVLIKSGRSA